MSDDRTLAPPQALTLYCAGDRQHSLVTEPFSRPAWAGIYSLLGCW